MKKFFIKLLSFLVVMLLFVTLMMPSETVSAKKIIDKKTKKSYELIESREDLLEEFKKHVFNLEESFKIYVASNVVKNFQKEFQGIWKDLCKDIRFNELWKHNTVYKSQFKDYSNSSAKCWEWNVSKMSYSISKKEAKKIVEQSAKIISSEKELIDAYTSNILKLNQKFSINVSKKVMKNFEADYEKLIKKLNEKSTFKNIMRYAEVTGSTPYDYNDFWKWNIEVKYSISKETAKEVIKGSTSNIKSLDKLVETLKKYVLRLDKKIVLKVDKKALDFSDQAKYNNLWVRLYNDPEFSDVFTYSKKFNHKLVNFKDYTEWIIDLDYDITKRELKSLDKFITKTLDSIVNDDMSDEEKVRAINDFMVKKYKLSYGDKGKAWYFKEGNSSKAKIGKYNVNTSYSLHYKKAGSSNAFANLFYRLAYEANLDVMIIAGKKGQEKYVWNLVDVDGSKYHISTIHNMSEEGKVEVNNRYHYLKGDETMKAVYEWDSKYYPVAEKDFK